MTALSKNPSNKNYLSPLVFTFVLKRAPNVNFFIQSVSLPGLMLDQVESANPFIQIPYGGDHLYFEELGIHFKVNEDLSNWLEIYNWIKSSGYPDQHSQYANLANKPKYSGEGLKSDISLLISDSNKKPSIDVNFKDALPISLSNLQFDSTTPGVNYLDAFCSFRYTSYDIKII